jgi:hypothetical protein
VLDAGLFETAKQDVAGLHSSAGAVGHCFASLDSIDRDEGNGPQPEQFRVTQQNGTELPGTGEYLQNKE